MVLGVAEAEKVSLPVEVLARGRRVHTEVLGFANQRDSATEITLPHQEQQQSKRDEEARPNDGGARNPVPRSRPGRSVPGLSHLLNWRFLDGATRRQQLLPVQIRMSQQCQAISVGLAPISSATTFSQSQDAGAGFFSNRQIRQRQQFYAAHALAAFDAFA